MGFYAILETVPIYSNNAYTIQCILTFSNTAALLFKESTEHGVVEVERNTLVTPFHAILERHLDLVWFAHWGFGVGVFFLSFLFLTSFLMKLSLKNNLQREKKDDCSFQVNHNSQSSPGTNEVP